MAAKPNWVPTSRTALDAFLSQCAEFDSLIAKLQEMRADHFNVDPEAASWGSAGSLGNANARLAEVVAFLSGKAI